MQRGLNVGVGGKVAARWGGHTVGQSDQSGVLEVVRTQATNGGEAAAVRGAAGEWGAALGWPAVTGVSRISSAMGGGALPGWTADRGQVWDEDKTHSAP